MGGKNKYAKCKFNFREKQAKSDFLYYTTVWVFLGLLEIYGSLWTATKY